MLTLWRGAAGAETQQADGWYWTGGCVHMDYWAGTTVTKAGKQGPKGYLRYENLGYVLFCLPT